MVRLAVGLSIIVGAALMFGNSFSTTVGCPWQNETSSTCQSGTLGTVNKPMTVQYTPCIGVTAGSEYGAQQFGLQVNLPSTGKFGGSATCKLHSCSGCLMTEQKCTKDGLPDGPQNVYCVPSQLEQDMRPLAPFFYVPMMFIGVVFLLDLIKLKKLQYLGIVIMCVGGWWIERSITILASCSESDVTGSCNPGWNGTLTVATEVFKSLNAAGFGSQSNSGILGGNPTFPYGPFATNARNSADGAIYGCAPLSCLVSTQRYSSTNPCTPDGTATYECEDGQAVSFASPVNLFFGMGMVLFGILIGMWGFLELGKSGSEKRLLDHA